MHMYLMKTFKYKEDQLIFEFLELCGIKLYPGFKIIIIALVLNEHGHWKT